MANEKQELQQQLSNLGGEYSPDDSRVVLREKIATLEKASGKHDDEQMVSVPSTLLRQMQQDIHNLKHGVATQPVQRITSHTARVKMHQDEYPVVGITKVWEENKGRPEQISRCTVVYLTGEKDEKKEPITATANVPYLDFLNEQLSCKVEIVKQDAEEIRDVKGTKVKRNPDPKKMGDTGSDWESGVVEDVVVSVNYTSIVKFLEGPLVGEEIKIKNNWLNL